MANEHAALLNSVLVRLGRNILLFQQIESGLKFVLPFVHPSGSARGNEAYAGFRDKARRQTLGQLAQSLQDSTSTDSNTLGQYLERMVEQRNQLVHHFHEIPGVSLSTEAGCRVAIQVLDDQHREAQLLQALLHAMALSLGTVLMKGAPEADEELAKACAALKQQLPATVEYVDLADPRETHWSTTRIVRALQEAESRTEPVNGMTSLSRAGDFLRSLDADLNSQAYGVSQLKRILMLSGVFDIVEHRPHDTAEPVTLYRSKPTDRLDPV